MTRPLRISVPGGFYHVVARGNERRAIFSDDVDRRRFLEILEEVLSAYDVRCHAYCLMTNHYHLLLETVRPNLSRAMRQLNGVYGQSFNRRRMRSGHVFQGRFAATLVERDTYLLEVSRYIALNPVRAGLVARPGEWEWSSYRAYAGLVSPPAFLCSGLILQALGSEGDAAARRAYALFIDEGVSGAATVAEVESFPPALGGAGFLRELQPTPVVDDDLPRAHGHLARPTLPAVFVDCAGRADRNRLIRIAFERYGYTQREIALHLGLHYTTVSQLLRRERRARPTPTIKT